MISSAREVFDVEAMIAGHVYKAPWDLDMLVDLLAQYAWLYRSAAERNECVFVVRD
ncbi:hypothetical protein [Allokutzneria sp. NRRL B-24872]|uniref:hypothetical protein n=1 Tax=Allokutzneria sp. NRRL B-24872 TaxID=1137961 RepID=UPI00143DDFA9|nr:hypothetical protein [Allokutzneria sp. NRRL B-24872]